MKNCSYVHRHLSVLFRVLGQNVAKHSLLFCFIVLLCTLVFSIGLYRIRITKDIEYLSSPINGRAKKERDAIESLFPPNNKEKSISTETRWDALYIIVIEPKNNRTALRKEIFNFLEMVDNAVKNVTISLENQTLSYRDVCQKSITGGCYVNEILRLKDTIKDIERKRFHIRYPIDNRTTTNYRFSFINMGGVTVDKDGYIEKVKAIRLIYYLNYSLSKIDKVRELWTKEFKQVLSYLHSDYANIFYYSKSIFDNEFNRSTEKALPFVFAAGLLMIIFAFLTCLTKDCVTSKPWIAVAGCLSPTISTVAAFGLLLFCGVEYLEMNIALFFLLIGVGLDDSFILLAAWRRTNPNNSVEDRMGETYSEAAISVTITSLTNVLCFCIGLTTPYVALRSFSAYGALSLLFGYIYQLTFFGAILALTGFMEKNNRHSLFCVQMKHDNFKECSIMRLLYYGWAMKRHDDVEKNTVLFFRDKLATALTKPLVKLFTILVFVFYLAGGIYSLRYLDPNYSMANAFPYDSHAGKAIVKHYEYFTHYPHPIIIVINGTLDYSRSQVQKEVQSIISAFATAPNMAGNELVISWLKVYLDTMNDARFLLSYAGYNMTDPEDFVYVLQNIFLRMSPFHKFKQDIIFNENKTKIIASRYVVNSKDIIDSEMERKLLLMLWDIADSCKYQVFIHNYWFLFYNHLTDVISCSIQSLCTAAVAIILIFIIFIPNVVCSVCVALTIVSVQTGVIGYMSLWGVNFDAIAMISLIVSAGLSVDYVSHVSYAYISSKYTDPNEKLKYTLQVVGYPIVQGCLSTLLGVSGAVLVPLHSLLVFFKIITLTMVFSGVHALFFLPVALNTWDILWSKK